MPRLQQVQQQIEQLTSEQREALLDWVKSVIEDELLLTDELSARTERAEQDQPKAPTDNSPS